MVCVLSTQLSDLGEKFLEVCADRFEAKLMYPIA